jgi:hypothetical protein
LDASGYAHIGYYDSTNDNLKYAYQDADGWYIQIVDNLIGGGSISLALDADGYSHISYSKNHEEHTLPHHSTKYAYQDSIGWHIQIVDGGDYYYDFAGYSSLALDGNGYPHISYVFGEKVKYAYQDVSGWYIQVVGKGSSAYTSIALSPGEDPNITYYTETDGLHYAYHDFSGWHVQAIDNTANAGRYSSLVLDMDGYPHISYYDGTSEDLKYAYLNVSGWHIQSVDKGGDVGKYTSLALDRNGHPHISYYGEGVLKYAYQNMSGWHYHMVDSGADVGEYTSLVLDTMEYPHISYYDRTNSNLKYAYQDVSGWHTYTVDREGDVGTYTSLSLDSKGYPHISYYDVSNGDLKYVYQDLSSWHLETVDEEGDVGQYSSLALDEEGDTHISYYDRTNADLKYAYRDATGWHIQTVDSDGDVGSFTSLALDANGYPHISYSIRFISKTKFGDDLKYAYQDAFGWHIQTVYTGIFVEFMCGNTSIALDANGYPHISFCYKFTNAKSINDVLQYAYQDAFGWHIQKVEEDAGIYNSLALSPTGNPHISYQSVRYHWSFDYGDKLFYTHHLPSGWSTEVVDPAKGVGGHTSLVLDADEIPHISYYDFSNSDLKYAHYGPIYYYLPILTKD